MPSPGGNVAEPSRLWLGHVQRRDASSTLPERRSQVRHPCRRVRARGLQHGTSHWLHMRVSLIPTPTASIRMNSGVPEIVPHAPAGSPTTPERNPGSATQMSNGRILPQILPPHLHIQCLDVTPLPFPAVLDEDGRDGNQILAEFGETLLVLDGFGFAHRGERAFRGRPGHLAAFARRGFGRP